MRLLAAAVLLALFLSAPPTTVFESCSCVADDGSCNASVACPGGCIAYCPSGACRARCLGTSLGEVGGAEALQRSVTVQLKRGKGGELASMLAGMTGKEIVFAPSRPERPFGIDVKAAPLWDVLEIMAEHGKVQIGGEDFAKLQAIRRALVHGEKMSVCISGASVRNVVNEFAAISGRSLRVNGGDENKLVTVSAREVTFDDLLALVAEQGGVEISPR